MAETKLLPEQARLLDLLRYDRATGSLIWIKNQGRAKAGSVAGTLDTQGYIVVKIDRTVFRAHRLIWKIVSGMDPHDEVDHIDGQPGNNRWENLRDCSRQQNMANSKLPSTNKSGLKGISWKKSSQKWQAKIKANSVWHHVGYFNDIGEASQAVIEKRRELHGDFARAR
jgi:hypothetical protein